MTSFSERQGLGHRTFQTDSMNDALKAGLWNAVYLSYRSAFYGQGKYGGFVGPGFRHDPDRWLKIFCEKLMTEVTKQPLPNLKDDYPLNRKRVLDSIQSMILKNPWNHVYELIEFFANNFPATGQINDQFRAEVNRVLERENAGYRFVGTHLARITADREIEAIEKTLGLSGPFDLASQHIHKALQLLSDRENPDYANSINESISAVEAACRVVSGNQKATLGDALKAIEDESTHPALRTAFEKLYGWTSDAAGMRHAMTGDTSVGFAEAQFMVVACSAFTNYLAIKSQAANC